MVDDKKISKTVEKFFTRDLQRDLMLIKSAGSVSAVRFDGMPSGSNGNGSERKMIAYSEAKHTLSDIKSAFELMDDDEAEVLNDLYLKNWSATKTAMELCMTSRTVYRLRKRAMLNFAYAFQAGLLIDRAAGDSEAKAV